MKHFRKKKECTGILVNENDFVTRNGKVCECGASWSAGHSMWKTQTSGQNRVQEWVRVLHRVVDKTACLGRSENEESRWNKTIKSPACSTKKFELYPESIWEPWRVSSQEDDIVELLFPKGWAFNPRPNEKGLQRSSSDRRNGKETDVRHMHHEGNISSIWPLIGERIRSQRLLLSFLYWCHLGKDNMLLKNLGLLVKLTFSPMSQELIAKPSSDPKWPLGDFNRCRFLEHQMEFLHLVDSGSPENVWGLNLHSQLLQLISWMPFILGRFSPHLPCDCGFWKPLRK